VVTNGKPAGTTKIFDASAGPGSAWWISRPWATACSSA
jgi:hypothetical protein